MAAPTSDQLLHIRRLAIGSSSATSTLSDADIEALWEDTEAGDGDVYLTAAAACDMLANAAALNFRWSADGASIDKTMQAAALRANAVLLRSRSGVAGYGSGTLTLVRHEDIGDEDTEYSA